MDSVHARFSEPQREFSPVATWWWSADRLDPERLRWQLRQMVDQGLHNILVISLGPTGPHMGTPMDDPRPFTDAWWDIFLEVCEESRRLGARLWMYDQIGFSSANLQEHLILAEASFEGQRIERHEVWLNGPQRVRAAAQGRVLGAVAYPKGGGPQALVVRDGEADWPGPGPARICVFYTVARGFDYYNPAACLALLDVIHGEFERRAGDYFGDVIAGTFQDELDRMPSWSFDFADEFRRQHGYDLVPRLTSLWEGDSLEDRRTRVHYQQTRTALAERSFFRPFYDWHTERGLSCGFDQKYPARTGDPLATVEYYGDYFATNRWYAAPGSDHGGETKVHSSIAHVNRRPRVWLEAFHSTGWGGTLEETFDWLIPRLRSGATLYNPHAVYYSTQHGWWEWAPPSTCWRQPYWRHYRHFAEAVTRLCGVLSEGRHLCDVALLYPTTTMQGGATRTGPLPRATRAQEIYNRLVGRLDMVRSRTDVGTLDGAGRDFDVVDDAAIVSGTVLPGRLCVADEEYRAVVLPACTVLPVATVRALVEFVEAGGALIAIGPIPLETVEDTDGNDLRSLQDLFARGRAHQVRAVDEVPGVLSELCPPRVEADVPTLLREVDGRAILFVPAAHPWATRLAPVSHRRDWAYDFDPARYRSETEVFVSGVRGAPQLWDIVTGATHPVRCRQESGGVRVWVTFEEAPVALLVWPAKDQNGTGQLGWADRHVMSVVEEDTAVTVEGAWTCDLVRTVDSTLGDDPQHAEHPDLPVQTWFVEHASGECDSRSGVPWHRIKATHGPYAWAIGPRSASELPAPGRLGASGPDSPGWTPVTYSLKYGVAGDPIHQPSFGLKGGVPDEFCQFGTVRAGEGVQLRTSVWSESTTTLHLAVGCPANKEAWINQRPIGACDTHELWLVPVTLQPGNNIVELRFVAEKDRELRAYWTLVREPRVFVRPEWMRAEGEPAKDSLVTFTTSFDAPEGGAAFDLQVAVDTGSASRVWIDDRLVGRQSGRCRIERYEEQLSPGQHQLRVDVLDPGHDDDEYAAVLVDALLRDHSGKPGQPLISDATWRVQRDDGPVRPVSLRRHSWWPARSDPSLCSLHRRPHPLPAALGRTAASPVPAFVPDAFPGAEGVETLRWTLPPGATAADIPVMGDASLTVDGQDVPLLDGWTPLPPGTGAARPAVLHVRPQPGRHAGALLDGPISYQMGTGSIEPGDWCDAGLDSYSGGMRYRTSFGVEAETSAARWTLDLGKVRGTVEVRLNGKDAGARVWAPYRMDVTHLVRDGLNFLEVLVFNTLAPALSALTDTPYVFAGQRSSGLFGPVRLLRAPQRPRSSQGSPDAIDNEALIQTYSRRRS